MKANTLTTWGKSHLATLIADNKPLKIAYIKVGDGNITTKSEALELTDLVNYKGTYPISSITKETDIVSIVSRVDNIGVNVGFMIREIGIYVEYNGSYHLFWYINNDNDITYVHSIVNGILGIDATYQMIYAGGEVTIENNYELDYFVSKKYLEQYTMNLGKLIMSETAPEPREDVIWIDTSLPLPKIPTTETDFIAKTLAAVRKMQATVDRLEYLTSYKLDPGLREALDDGTRLPSEIINDGIIEDPNTDIDYVPNMDNYVDAKSGKIAIARGNRINMGSLLPGEMFYEITEKALYIGDQVGGVSLLAKVGGSEGGSGSLTGEYLELTSPKGIVYKVKVTDAGLMEIYKSSVDNVPLPNPSAPDIGGEFHENWDNYKDTKNYGICINQIYSGGSLNAGDTPVSHSFIELYNNSERDINLRGLSIQYAKTGTNWKVCKLDGVVPGNSSYLIRCVLNNNPYKLACRVKINDFDLDWNQELSPTGMKVVLVVGTDPLTTENPYRDPVNGVASIYRYIDMLAAGGVKASEKVDYVEGYFARQCLDKNTSICRRFRVGSKDKDDNLLDTIPVDYRYADLGFYGPKCRADGPWDIYRDKLKLSDSRPNMLFVTFGKEQSTRIFTWQSTPTTEGYLKIYKLADTVFENGKYKKVEIPGYKRFKTYSSSILNISHHDTSACTHKVFVRNLTPGVYIYKAGEEGKWSDENEIEIFHDNYGDFTSALLSGEKEEDRNIRFIQTTDQQGWDGEEYKAWKHAAKFIRDKENLDVKELTGRSNYDFRVNTGDASQNGNRSYEWRYYYDGSKEDLVEVVEMSVAGNNDLVDKNKSEAYTYYTTYEDSPYPSCYEFFIGDVHFLGIHTWAAVDVDYVDSDGGKGFTKLQQEWLYEKLKGPRKKWTIVLTHVSPYTVVKYKYAQPYGPIMDGTKDSPALYTGVDVTLCGHNHAYSRSKSMKDGDVVDPLDGVYHVMCQATGYKLSGKSGPNPSGEVWYATNPDGSYAVGTPPNPTYILWEVTKDYIEMNTYMITGIVHKDATTKEVTYGKPEEFTRELVDTFKIYHRDVRSEHLDEL